MERDTKQTGYKKIRSYLITENVFIVLAFLLIAVGVYNFYTAGYSYWFSYAYVCGGIILLVVGIVIAIKMIRAFQRNDIPAYVNIMDSPDVDPESGLLYYDQFMKQADTRVQLALTPCYLACFQIEGFEHLRHFVGYQKAADTMAEIGMILKDFEKLRNSRNVLCGKKSGHELVMLVQDFDRKEFKLDLQEISQKINAILLKLPTAETFTTYCGYSSYPHHAASVEEMVKNSSFAVYEAVMFRKTDPHYFSPDAFKRQETEYMKDNKLRMLLDKNELLYKFQPIVSAKTGKIYAYEALMRSKSEIGLSPVDILELAQRQDRLYEVEHYTFYNVLRIMNEHEETFANRKLFLNSIPTAIIKENEFDELLDQYKDLMKSLVIEITENGMQSEESCAAVHKYMEKSGCELALDDYGTGYSNASTLLNNSPNYLKIDHSMIMGIDTDSKKQHLVSSYVSFANNHNMKILAEGVETPEELQMVIQLGCHLIQGFYTGRPNSQIVEGINEEIEKQIVAINLKLAKLAYENKVYEANNYDLLSLINLALDFYSQIYISHSTTKIVGETEREVSMGIRVKDNTDTVLTLCNVNIRGRENPAIEIGENCQVVLCLEGDNVLSYEGIRVPKSSKLIVQGDGNLTIHVDHNNGIGIGCALESEAYGNIWLEGKGTIRVETNGEVAIGIGGVLADENSEIRISSGNIEIIATGSKSIGIGSVQGPTRIILDNCDIAISSSAADSIGIGSFNGDVDIASIANIEMDVSGSVSTGIGTLWDRAGKVAINDGEIKILLHCMEGVGIGSKNGDIDTYIFGREIFVYVEGSDVGGIGNYHGGGDTYIRGGIIKVVLLAANPISLGGIKGRLEISSGNVFCDIGNGVQPVNAYGIPVYHREVSDSDRYYKKIETEEGTYQYRAEPSDLFENIHIFVPKFCLETDLQT